MNILLGKPSAWVPLSMSLAALSLLMGYVLIFGVPAQPEPDEGTAAHIFQFLMGGQVLVIAFFLLRWAPKFPKESLMVFTLQILAALAAFVSLFILEK